MNLFSSNLFFGVFITLVPFVFGLYLQKKFKKAIFNPILISTIIIVFVLKELNISYGNYLEGAKYVSYLLTPATVCLAVPLYQEFDLLKSNWKAILIGIFSGVVGGMLCILGLAFVFGLSHSEYVTLLPKSITTAIGIGLSEELNGIVPITVTSIIVTGVLGNMTAEALCKLFRIKSPIAKGIAIGTASHAVGTAKAIEMGKIEGAMSGLAIGVTGLMTVVAASIFASFM